MLEVEQAFERIIAHFSPLDAVELPVLECLGMVLAEDVTSPLNLPPLANSAMDGYAVRNEDIAAANDVAPTLSVISVVAAGQVSDRTITRGNAIRIMTGAPVPNGADTVVPFEETDELERRGAGTPLDEIVIRKALPLGSNVRPAGEDVRAGELVLTAGTVVRPAEAGVLASLGLATARVIRRPVVAVLSTGDELTTVGNDLAPGHIYDSNSSSVAAAVRAAGGVAKIIGIARDNLDDLPRCIDAASDADLLVTSARRVQGRLRHGQGRAGAAWRHELLVGADAAGQAVGVRADPARRTPATAFAGLAREPGQRAAGVRNVRSRGRAPHVGTGPAGPPRGGRGAHRADIQQ